MDKLTQCARIKQYIKEHGSISVAEGFSELHINSLTRRICDLQESGYPIKKQRVSYVGSDGQTIRCVRYSRGRRHK